MIFAEKTERITHAYRFTVRSNTFESGFVTMLPLNAILTMMLHYVSRIIFRVVKRVVMTCFTFSNKDALVPSQTCHYNGRLSEYPGHQKNCLPVFFFAFPFFAGVSLRSHSLRSELRRELFFFRKQVVFLEFMVNTQYVFYDLLRYVFQKAVFPIVSVYQRSAIGMITPILKSPVCVSSFAFPSRTFALASAELHQSK